MNKFSYAALSLIAAIPGGYLCYLLVMAMLDRFGRMATMFQVMVCAMLMCAVVVTVTPIGILIFVHDEKARKDEDEESADEADEVEAVDEIGEVADVEESDEIAATADSAANLDEIPDDDSGVAASYESGDEVASFESGDVIAAFQSGEVEVTETDQVEPVGKNVEQSQSVVIEPGELPPQEDEFEDIYMSDDDDVVIEDEPKKKGKKKK